MNAVTPPVRSPPLLLSLDIASSTGICEGRVGEPPRFETLRFGRDGDDHEEVFCRALRWIAGRLTDDPRPDAVFVEAPVNPGAFVGEYDPVVRKVRMRTNPDTTIRLMGLWAIVAAAVKVRGVRYERVDVRTARAEFLGDGGLKRDEAKRRAFEMCKLLGWSPANRDEGDAGCVHYYGSVILAPRLAPVVTPMMHMKVATTVAGVDLKGDDRIFRKPEAAR
jgi:hypothetical protein